MLLKKLFQWVYRTLRAQWRCLTRLQPYTEQSKPGIVLMGVAADFSLMAGISTGQDHKGVLNKPGIIQRIARMVVARQQVKLPTRMYNAGMLDDIDDFDEMDFDEVQIAQYLKVLLSLMRGHFPVVLGGGYAISIASYQALSDHLAKSENIWGQKWFTTDFIAGSNSIGVINFDRNLELRLTPSPKLDSVFYAVNNYCQSTARPFHYLGLGICKRTNPTDAFDYADQLGCDWLLDKEMTIHNKEQIQKKIEDFMGKVDHIHLSFDLSVLRHNAHRVVHPADQPGLSWSMAQFALALIARSGKVRILDVVGLPPESENAEYTSAYMADAVSTVLQHQSV